MSIDLFTLAVLAEPMARVLFEQVAKNRSIRFEQLLKRVQFLYSTLSREDARATLQQLKNAQLIGEISSPIEDFNTYYITAEGLEAGRKIGI